IDGDPATPNQTHTGLPAGQYVGLTVEPNTPVLKGTITFSLINDADGHFVIDPDTGRVTLAGGAIDPGTYIVVARATAAGGDIVDTAFRILVTPDAPPVAKDDNYGVTEDHTLTVLADKGVLANDSDPDGDPLSVTLATGPSHGEVMLNAD